MIPNLTYSSPEIFEYFEQIVGEGAFIGKEMPNFKDRLSNQDILDLKNYILSDAKDMREEATDHHKEEMSLNCLFLPTSGF